MLSGSYQVYIVITMLRKVESGNFFASRRFAIYTALGLNPVVACSHQARILIPTEKSNCVIAEISTGFSIERVKSQACM